MSRTQVPSLAGGHLGCHPTTEAEYLETGRRPSVTITSIGKDGQAHIHQLTSASAEIYAQAILEAAEAMRSLEALHHARENRPKQKTGRG
jgi:hypothetical protein